MKLQAFHGFSLGGGRDVVPGEVFFVEDVRGKQLVANGSAFIVPETAVDVVPAFVDGNEETGDPCSYAPGMFTPFGATTEHYPPASTSAGESITATFPTCALANTPVVASGVTAIGYDAFAPKEAHDAWVVMVATAGATTSSVTIGAATPSAIGSVTGELALALYPAEDISKAAKLVSATLSGTCDCALAVVEAEKVSAASIDASCFGSGSDEHPTTEASDALASNKEIGVAFLVVSGDPFDAGSEPLVSDNWTLFSTTKWDGVGASPLTVYIYQRLITTADPVGFAATLAESRNWSVGVVTLK
jgi:hypothetical protein